MKSQNHISINQRLYLFLSGCLCLFGFVLLLLTAGCQSASKSEPIDLDEPPPAPGSCLHYQYRHTGPRPWGDGVADVSGRRVVSMTGKAGTGKKPLWIFEERFEKTSGTLIGYYDADYLLHRQRLRAEGGEIEIVFSEPIPVRYIPLKAGDKETIQSTQTILNPQTGGILGTAVYTDTTKREKDVRIISPAGAFLCRHFISRVTMKATIQGETTTFSATSHTYWCDRIGWFVKEELTFDPLIQEGTVLRPGYSTVSMLEKYEQEEGEETY